MTGSDGSINIDAKLNTSDFEKGVEDMKASAESLSNSLSDTAKKVEEGTAESVKAGAGDIAATQGKWVGRLEQAAKNLRESRKDLVSVFTEEGYESFRNDVGNIEKQIFDELKQSKDADSATEAQAHIESAKKAYSELLETLRAGKDLMLPTEELQDAVDKYDDVIQRVDEAFAKKDEFEEKSAALQESGGTEEAIAALEAQEDELTAEMKRLYTELNAANKEVSENAKSATEGVDVSKIGEAVEKADESNKPDLTREKIANLKAFEEQMKSATVTEGQLQAATDEYNASLQRVNQELASADAAGSGKEMKAHLAQAQKEYDALKQNVESMQGKGVISDSAADDLQTLEALNKKIEATQSKIRVSVDEESEAKLQEQLQALVDKASGVAKQIQSKTAESPMTSVGETTGMRQAEQDLQTLTVKYQNAEYAAKNYNSAATQVGVAAGAAAQKMEPQKQKTDEVANSARKASDETKKQGDATKKAGDASKGAAKHQSKFGDALKNVTAKLKGGVLTVLKYAFSIRSVFALFKKMKDAAKEGFGSLAQQFPEFNDSMSMITNSLSKLKYSFAGAFAPLITTAAPYIKQFVDMLSSVIAKVGEFIAAISGQETYYRAIDTQESYAESLEDTADAAKDAAGQLMGFDKLNVINSNSGSGGSGKGKGKDNTIRYEEVAVSEGMRSLGEKGREFIEKLKPIFEAAKTLFTTLTTTATDFFNTIYPFLQPIIDAVLGLIVKVLEFIGNLAKTLAPVVAKIIQAISPIIKVVIDGISNIFDRLNKSGVLEGLSKALISMLENAQPLFDVIGRILGFVLDIIGRILVAAMDLGNKILPVIGQILGFIGEIIGVIWDILEPIIDGVMDALEEILPAIGTLFTAIGSALKGIMNLLKPIFNVIKSIIQKTMPAVKKGLGGVGKVVAGIVELLSWVIGGFKGGIMGMLKKIAGGIANIALSIAQSFVGLIKGIVDVGVKLGIIKKESTGWVDEWTTGLENAQRSVDEWASGVEDAGDSAGEAIGETADGLLDKWDATWSSASDDTTEYLDEMGDDFDLAFGDIENRASSAANKTSDSVKTIKQNALKQLSELHSSGEITAEEYEKFLKGIGSSNADTVKATASQVASAYLDTKKKNAEAANAIKQKMTELYQNGVITWDEYRKYLGQINNGEVADKKKAIEEIERLYDGAAASFKEKGKKAGSVYVAGFTEEMAELKRKAQTWGKDLCDNLAAGMNNNKAVVNTASIGVARQVAQNLAFSEPEKGPLSKTHTFMPDMIKLLVSGINSNAYKVENSVAAMAAQMKDELMGGYASLSNVPFVRPAMSTGSILPYGVAMQRNGYSGYDEQAPNLSGIESLMTNRNNEEMSLLRELIDVVKRKNLTISPSASLGKVVNASARLYQGVTG